VTFQRGIDGSDPARARPAAGLAGIHQERRSTGSWRLGSGTLACPLCDAPIALGGRTVSPADDLHCPFCRHGAPVRDFLSLAIPTRPARVRLRVRMRDRIGPSR
jgi:hypothetical protein